jgi:hypothetical protein
MEVLQEFQEDLSLLVEGGLLAIKQGDEESAKKLFNAVDILDASGLQKKFGYGLIALHKMEIDNAVKQFEEILQKEKQNWRAQAFLGFAYILSIFSDVTDMVKEKNLKKAAELAKEVVTNCKEESTVRVGQSILDWEAEIQGQVKKSRVL